jgi:hypothetical protein
VAERVSGPQGSVALSTLLRSRCSHRESATPHYSKRVFPPIAKQDWAATLELPTVEPELVLRSVLTLKALVHHDTGAIMATATTSLPREPATPANLDCGIQPWDQAAASHQPAATTTNRHTAQVVGTTVVAL